MNIVIIQGAFFPVPPVQGGAVEKIWWRMGKEFARLGHTVTHISKALPGKFPEEELVDGVHYIRVKGYDTPESLVKLKLLDLWYTLRAIRKIPRQADIIVTNTFWAPLLIGKKQRLKVYVSVERFPHGQLKWYKGVGRFRGNSSSVAEAIRKELPSSLVDKIGMVPNPLPFSLPKGAIDGPKQKNILYVGRLHPEKGVDILIKAFLGLKERHDWSLIIVGPSQINSGGGGADYLASLKKSSGNNKSIVFVGPVFDEKKLSGFYQKAAIFVYPSLADKGETFGLAPLEAMAWGCVPVVSAIPCFKDFISDRDNGLIFDHHAPDKTVLLTKRLEELINDEGFRKKLSQKATGVNTTHSLQVIASSFLHDFQLLSKNN